MLLYRLAQKPVEHATEGVRRVEGEVVVRALDLDHLGAWDRGAKARRHVGRQDGAQLAAHDERGCSDARQERPAVHRLPVGVARRVEAVAIAAFGPDQSGPRQMLEQRGIGGRLLREQTELPHRLVLGGVQSRRSLPPRAHPVDAIGRQLRP